MPYVNQEARERLQSGVPKTPGELNYVLTMACGDYLRYTPQKYVDYNALIGALECCKLEMYRRQIAKYEDLKIIENGDVYA